MAAMTFTIRFNVDPPNVQQALDAVNNSLKNVGVSITNVAETAPKVNALDDSFTKIGLRLQGIQNLFNIVTSSFGSIVAASNAAESATVKLSQALQNQGIYTQELVAEMQAFASARQELTGIDDDATVAIMGQLTAMGLQGQALKDATVAVQDLATLMDGDMNGAVRVVADAFSGNTGMLKRYIKGLDETDIKQRGTISIIEQLQRAIGGQAEAFGNTGAGAMKKFQAALDDFREAMGNALSTVLTPFLAWASEIVKWLGQLPPSMQAVVVSGTALAAMFAFINSSAGLLPYALGAIGSSLLIVVNAIKEGNPLMAALGAAFGALGVAVLALNAKLLLTSTTITTIVIPALTALKAAILTHPFILAAAGIAAIGTAMLLASKEIDVGTATFERFKESAASLDSATITERINEINEAIAENNRQLSGNIQLKELQRIMSLDPREREAELSRLRFLGIVLDQEKKALESELNLRKQSEDKRKQAEQAANDPTVQLKMQELRVQAMQDGVAKRLALLDIEKKKQEQAWNEENLSEKQRQDLKSAYNVA